MDPPPFQRGRPRVTPLRFIETNILVRHISRDGELQAQLSDQLLLQIAEGDIEGLLSMTVVFETAYVLEKFYRFARADIARSMSRVINTPGIRLLAGEAVHYEKTIELYTSIPQLSFADCYHAVLSLENCNGEIYTFDQDFRRVAGITRLEPGA